MEEELNSDRIEPWTDLPEAIDAFREGTDAFREGTDAFREVIDDFPTH